MKAFLILAGIWAIIMLVGWLSWKKQRKKHFRKCDQEIGKQWQDCLLKGEMKTRNLRGGDQ